MRVKGLRLRQEGQTEEGTRPRMVCIVFFHCFPQHRDLAAPAWTLCTLLGCQSSGTEVGVASLFPLPLSSAWFRGTRQAESTWVSTSLQVQPLPFLCVAALWSTPLCLVTSNHLKARSLPGCQEAQQCEEYQALSRDRQPARVPGAQGCICAPGAHSSRSFCSLWH